MAAARKALTTAFLATTMVGLLMGAVGDASASVPPDDVQSGNGNIYVVFDSTQPTGPTPNSLGVAPSNELTSLSGVDDGFATALDDGSPIDLGFDFTYHGVTYTDADTISVGANGTIFWTPPFTAGNEWTNSDLQNAADGPVIAPFWDDLEPAVCGAVFFEVFGTTPTRVAVFEWRNVCDQFSPNPVDVTDGFTFQVQLFETSNVIEFHYADVQAAIGTDDDSNNGRSATIGLGGGIGGPYVQYAHNRTMPTTPLDDGGFAIGFAPCAATEHFVSDASALDAAIACYNQQTPSGDHTITFESDITHPTGAVQVDSATDTGDLTIDGAGFSLIGPRGADGTIPGNGDHELLDIFNLDGPVTTVRNLSLLGSDRNALILVGSTIVNSVETTNNALDAALIGDGTHIITNSTLSDSGVLALLNPGGVLLIEDSTITSDFTGLRQQSEGRITVANSTIVADSEGYSTFGGGDIAFINATIESQQSAALRDIPLFDVPTIRLENSIVRGATEDCSFTQAQLTVVASFGTDGTCTGTTTLSAGSLDPAGLADNGCIEPCTQTIALLAGSNAIGAGDCTNLTDVNGTPLTLDFDQRGQGFPRTLGANCDAGAFEANVCGNPNATVTTAAELDDAIACFNNQFPVGNHTITFGNDIEHPSGPPAIIEPNGNDLTIDGDGFTLSGPFDPNADAPFANLLQIDTPGVIGIGDLTVTNSTLNALVVRNGFVELKDVDLADSNTGIDANGGSTSVIRSTISGNRFDGVRVTGPAALTISESTIQDNAGSGILGLGGTVLLTNSTVARTNGGDGDGVKVSDPNAAVTIANSTVVDNENGLTFEQGQIRVLSSIVARSNGSDCLFGGAGTLDDQGGNFTTGPFCDFTTLEMGSLGSLADNGGPTQTVELFDFSNAVDAGTCANVPVLINPTNGDLILGDLDFDQRGPGFARTLGADCDAGSFEVAKCLTAEPVVASADELDEAIECFNAQTPPGEHTITFGGDIAHPTGTPTITEATGATLSIAGAGFELSGPGIVSPTSTFSQPALLQTFGTDNGSLFVDDLSITVTDSDSVGLVLRSGTTVVDTARFEGGTTGLWADNGSRTAVVLSQFLNHEIDGLFAQDSATRLQVTSSTFTRSNVGVNSSATLFVSGSTLIESAAESGLGAQLFVSNSTVHGGFRGVVVSNGGNASIANSTIAGQASHALRVFDGSIAVRSSVVASAPGGTDCDGDVVNRGFNFSNDESCAGFGPLSAGSLAAAPASNGGPTETIELLDGSNAIGGGECRSAALGFDQAFQLTFGDLLSDQRGELRPARFTCDAGAFENPDDGSTPLPALFVPVTPCAVYDSRQGVAVPTGQSTLTAQITGPVDQSGEACATAGVVPAGATSVMVNVVAVNPLASGNLRISASGTDATGGVVNYGPGNAGAGTNANAVPVALSADGQVDVFVNSSAGVSATHVRLVVLGYHVQPAIDPNGLAFVPVTPCAVFDTRVDGGGPATGQSIETAQITGSVPQSGQDCAEAGVVPDGAEAVMVNVVAVNPQIGGNLRISASGTEASGGVVNYGPGNAGAGTNANAVPVALSDNGAVDVFVNSATGIDATHVRLVVLGYYTSETQRGAFFNPITPCAVFDTRVGGAAPATGQTTLTADLQGDQSGTDCASVGAIPNVSAAMVNVVAVNPEANGNLRVAAAGVQASGGVVNYGPGDAGPGTNSNAVPIGLNPGSGAIDIDINTAAGVTATHVRLVVLGYYNPVAD